MPGQPCGLLGHLGTNALRQGGAIEKLCGHGAARKSDRKIQLYTHARRFYTRRLFGGIAQLGERLHGMQEVSGSIPLTSTKVFENGLVQGFDPIV